MRGEGFQAIITFIITISLAILITALTIWLMLEIYQYVATCYHNIATCQHLQNIYTQIKSGEYKN